MNYTPSELVGQFIYYLHRAKACDMFQSEYYQGLAQECLNKIPARELGRIASIMAREGLTQGHSTSQNW